jgi:hypothetical protein
MLQTVTPLRIVLCAGLLASCHPAGPPPPYEVVELHGTPYQRGRQHGERLRSKVRSLYTMLLESAILPNLNREVSGLAAVFDEYQQKRYANGHFAYELLLDSARSLEGSLSPAHRDELRGIADGAGMPYDHVLLLNTFFDSVMAVRSVVATVSQAAAPRLERVEVVGGLETDGVDNDGNGLVDEPGEGGLDYLALPHAALVELPPDARIRLVLAATHGVDPKTVRLTLGAEVYGYGDPAIAATALDSTHLEVILTPPAPLGTGAIALGVQAGDLAQVTSPPPVHAHLMRAERITFTVRGTGLLPREVDNRGLSTPREHPTALAFAARGTATADGAPLLAQHFALLDANTAHKHSVVFIHHPDGGPPFAVVGWAGVAWGMSGMNESGLAAACDPSDTLDNSVLKGLLERDPSSGNPKLLASGEPVGFFLRQVLEGDATAAEAVSRAAATAHAFGWACLFADAAGGLRAAELDSGSGGTGTAFDYGPEDTDGSGVRLASSGPDDLRIASHFVKHADDLTPMYFWGQPVRRQRDSSVYYFRSLQTWSILGERIAARRGTLDGASAEELLRTPELVDPSDSMNAVVYEPGARRFRVAMGVEPATAGSFESLSLDGAGR